jgi:hypothetical protein
LVNQAYGLQPINNYNLFVFPFLIAIGMIHNNPAFAFYCHYDKTGTVDGQMIYPKRYALTQIGTTGYYLSDGDNNNGEMGFGQKPVFAIGVIDMRENLLDYTKN